MRCVLAACLFVVACADEPFARLTRERPEPPGVHCADGGLAIATGLDNNDNGVLDDPEVDTIHYVCDEPLAQLSRQDAATPEQCLDGGVVSHTGRDSDRDGALDDEIEESTVVCGAAMVWEGDLTIDVSVELERFRALREVHGNLTLIGSGDATLPVLARVTGSLVIRHPIGEVSLPVLARVDGGLASGGRRELKVPALVQVGRLDLHSHNQVAFTSYTLERIDGPLTISGRVATVRLRALTQVGSLRVYEADELSTLDLSELRDVAGSLEIDHTKNLSELILPELTLVGGDLEVSFSESLWRVDLAQLTEIGGKLSLTSDEALNMVMLPRLTRIGGPARQASSGLGRVDLSELPSVGTLHINSRGLELDEALPGGLSRVNLGSLATAERLTISGFSHVVDRLDLDQLRSVSARLVIEDLAGLASLSLPALEDVSELIVDNGPELAALQLGSGDAAPTIGHLSLIGLELCSAAAQRLPPEIPGTLQLTGHRCPDLAGLAGITRAGVLSLMNNGTPITLTGLSPELELEHLELYANPGLTSLHGLEVLGPSLPGDLIVHNNTALVDLAGLGSLTHVGGDVRIAFNHDLPSLAGLALHSIGGDLQIRDNYELDSLAGLGSLVEIGGAIEIHDNLDLSQAEIDAFKARF